MGINLAKRFVMTDKIESLIAVSVLFFLGYSNIFELEKGHRRERQSSFRILEFWRIGAL